MELADESCVLGLADDVQLITAKCSDEVDADTVVINDRSDDVKFERNETMNCIIEVCCGDLSVSCLTDEVV